VPTSTNVKPAIRVDVVEEEPSPAYRTRQGLGQSVPKSVMLPKPVNKYGYFIVTIRTVTQSMPDTDHPVTESRNHAHRVPAVTMRIVTHAEFKDASEHPAGFKLHDYIGLRRMGNNHANAILMELNKYS
jgi:hypothetical protein